MSKSRSAASSGIGLSGATFLVFLVMRLTDNIDWSWYWVASPLWLPVVSLIGLVVAMLPFIFFYQLHESHRDSKARARTNATIRSRIRP